MSARPDPVRVRHAVVLASVVGLVRASAQVGVSPARICEWRRDLEAGTGETLPRRHDLKGNRRPFPLTPAQIAEIRPLRARGYSFAELGRRYGVSRDTIRKACAGA